jgi:hypothetical protein
MPMNTNIPMTEEKFYETAVKAYNTHAITQASQGYDFKHNYKHMSPSLPELTREATLFIKSKIANGELYYGPGNLLFPNPKANVPNRIKDLCKITPRILWITLQWLPTLNQAPESSEISLNPNTVMLLNEMLTYAKETHGECKTYIWSNERAALATQRILELTKKFIKATTDILTPRPAPLTPEEEKEKLYTHIVKEINKRTIIRAHITAHKKCQTTPFLNSDETAYPGPGGLTIKTVRDKLYDQNFDYIEAKQFIEQKVANNELYYGLGNILFHNPQAQVQVPDNIKNIRKTSPQKLWVALQWLPTLEKALINARTENSIDRLPEDLKAHIQIASKSSKNQGKIGLAPNTAQHLVEMLKYASIILKNYENHPIYKTIQIIQANVQSYGEREYLKYTTNHSIDTTTINGDKTHINIELIKTSKKFVETTNNLLTTLFDPNYGFQKLNRSDAPARPSEEPILDTALSPAI